MFFGEDNIFLYLRSGALGFSFGPDDGKAIWVGLLFSLLALPDKQVSINVVEILGFLNDIAPKELYSQLTISHDVSEPQHIFQSHIVPHFDLAVVSLMRLQSSFPISSPTDAILRFKLHEHCLSLLEDPDEDDENADISRTNLVDVQFMRYLYFSMLSFFSSMIYFNAFTDVKYRL